MRRAEPTDLICRARRGELDPEERRQLQDALDRSGEMRLLSTMLSEFERESQVRPGDDVLLARIGERALGLAGEQSTSPTSPLQASSRWGRQARLTILLAAALTLLGSAAWAWRTVFHASFLAPAPKPVPSAPAVRSTQHQARGVKVRAPVTEAPMAVVPLDEPVPEPPSPIAAPERPSPRARASATALDPAQNRAFNPASELFARANALRRQGRSAEAAALYSLVLEDHPTSREAPPARLALAKLLRVNAPARALTHFRELARRGGSLRAEALWGMAESARSLGNSALEAQALSDLLREYPDSPYADVARARTPNGGR